MVSKNNLIFISSNTITFTELKRKKVLQENGLCKSVIHKTLIKVMVPAEELNAEMKTKARTHWTNNCFNNQ
jgi:hypothetical protein